MVTIENHELVDSCKINETLAKKLLDYPDRVIALEHDLHIRHEVNRSENGGWTSTARMKLAEGCDLVELATKLKTSHTTLLEQASAWKAANKKAMKDKPEDEVYVCLKRMKQGYKIQGNMPLEEVVNTLASMFISYAAKKQPE